MPLTRTVQQVIQIANEHEDMDPARGLQLLNEAHLQILSQIHLVPDVQVDITLVAGQMEYALPDACIAIWDASYWVSATSHQVLKSNNVDKIYNDQGPNWGLQASGTPQNFYERGGKIGLVPPPAIATSGGYPKVTLYYTAFTALGLGDSLPTTISSVYPWVYHMLVRQAAVESPDKIPLYANRFKIEMEMMHRWIFGRVARDKTRIRNRTPMPRRA